MCPEGVKVGLRGRALFDEAVAAGGAGCAACHSGALFTTGIVVPGKTEGTQTDVPGLIGVYDTAPYGRQAQWVTLEAMLDRALTYTGAEGLGPDERAALLAYLRQIPADALWLNSTRPLSGANHVWTETPIELTFSHRLAAGQAERFTITRGEGEPVAGAWSVRGRVARFVPQAPLDNETDYRITVDAPLAGALGQQMRAPIAVDFRTGGEPELDVSGRYRARLDLQELGFGRPRVEVAALQSAGGDVTGVIDGLDAFIELPHVEGMVSGTRLVLEPFLLATQFGEFNIEEAYMDIVDEDGDGYGDTGEGFIRALGQQVGWSATRIASPGE